MNDPKPDQMNMQPVEEFVSDFAMMLAGSLTQSEATDGLTPEQLGVIFFSAVGSFCRTRPDYNPAQEISDVIRLGVAVYGESVYATVNAALNEAQQNGTVQLGDNAPVEPGI